MLKGDSSGNHSVHVGPTDKAAAIIGEQIFMGMTNGLIQYNCTSVSISCDEKCFALQNPVDYLLWAVEELFFDFYCRPCYMECQRGTLLDQAKSLDACHGQPT